MSSSKREREHALRRQEKWEQRRQLARARKQRIWALVALAAALLVVAVAVIIALNASDDAPTDASDVPSAEASTAPADASEPTPDQTYTLAPPSAAEDREWTGTLQTSVGEIGFTLDGAAAPQAVANFVSLGKEGYFDGNPCHRLTTSGLYVLQCGDPTGTGTGSPGYEFGPIENAPADGIYPAGTIAMARAQAPDSMGSQFFLVYEDTTLPTDTGGYTVFGKITSGLDVVRAVADAGTTDGSGDGSPATPVTIEGVETQ